MVYRLILGLCFSLSLNLNVFAQTEEIQPAEETNPVKESAARASDNSQPPALPISSESEADSVAESEQEAEPPKEASFAPVTFREKVAFKIYYLDESKKERTISRANEATSALDRALTSSDPFEPNAPMIEIVPQASGFFEVKVRGYKIIQLSPGDRVASGFKTSADYQDFIKAELGSFVSNEVDRLEVQKVALKFFLSIFFALMGFVVFRQIHQVFNKAELILEQKRESFEPVVVLSETLVSGQAMGGLLALSLAVGRMIAYVVVILSTLAAILGQFTTSRVILTQFFSQSLSQVVKGLQSLLEAIPGLLLGLVLIFLFQLSLKVLDLFLKGARSGRINLSFLSPSRVPVVKFWGTALLFIILTPLIVAAIFGRFHTPLEVVFLLVAFALALATLPVLVSVAAGSFVLWQGVIKPGQWIEIGAKSGEVTDVSIHKITIVPETGGRVHVPMSMMLFKACFEKKDAPKAEYQVTLVRKDNLENTLSTLGQLFPQELEVSLECISVGAKSFMFAIYAPQFKSDLRSKVLKILSQAHEMGVIELGGEMIKEVRH